MGRKLVGMMRWMSRMAMSTTPKLLSTRRGCFTRREMIFTYLWLPTASQWLMRRNTTFGFLLGSLAFMMSEHITGLRVSATTVESNTDTTMVTVNWR